MHQQIERKIFSLSLIAGFLAMLTSSCEKKVKYYRSHYENGQLEYEVPLDKRGDPHGRGVGYYRSGAVQVEEYYRSGRKDSTYILYGENGEVREKGQYEDGLRSGEWLFYAPGTGKLRMKGSYGITKAGQIRKAHKAGTWTTYDPETGTIVRQGTYKYDLKDGEWESWYRNGQMASRGAYKVLAMEGDSLLKRSIKIGTWSYWDSEGNPSRIESYDSTGIRILGSAE